MLVNNEDGSAGPTLVELVVFVISGPVALLLEPQTAHICALNFSGGFESSLAAWTSRSFLWVKHRGPWFDVGSHPTSVFPSLCPVISPWEIATGWLIVILNWGNCRH